MDCFINYDLELLVNAVKILLQLWAFEHLLIWKRKGGTPSSRFPRILHWMDVKVGDFVVSRSLKKKAVSLIFVYNL